MLASDHRDAHHALAAFAGSFIGDETLFAGPWDPAGGRSIGRLEARLALDGLLLVSDYTQERAGRVTMRGHGVYGFDAEAGLYRMTWFDSDRAGKPVVAEGSFTGGTLTYVAARPNGRSRYLYRLEPEGYHFRIELCTGDGPWAPVLDALYLRSAT